MEAERPSFSGSPGWAHKGNGMPRRQRTQLKTGVCRDSRVADSAYRCIATVVGSLVMLSITDGKANTLEPGCTVTFQAQPTDLGTLSLLLLQRVPDRIDHDLVGLACLVDRVVVARTVLRFRDHVARLVDYRLVRHCRVHA